MEQLAVLGDISKISILWHRQLEEKVPRRIYKDSILSHATMDEPQGQYIK